MLSVFWAHFCLEFAIRVCCGRLLTAISNPSFCFKIESTTNGMQYTCSANYKQLCEQICLF